MTSFFDRLARFKARASKTSDTDTRKQADRPKEAAVLETSASQLYPAKTLSRTSSMSSTLVPEDELRRSSVQSTGAVPKGIVYGARDWRKYSVGSQGR